MRMLSLDLLDKVAKRLDFHSTAIIFLDFFDKDQTSLNITRLHSTHSTRWPNGSIFSSIFCRVKNRVKNRVVWPRPKILRHCANKDTIHVSTLIIKYITSVFCDNNCQATLPFKKYNIKYLGARDDIYEAILWYINDFQFRINRLSCLSYHARCSWPSTLSVA